jgi:parallel beta-helix repeat protein
VNTVAKLFDAIGQSNPGDTVRLRAGTYRLDQSVVLEKGIRIVGLGQVVFRPTQFLVDPMFDIRPGSSGSVSVRNVTVTGFRPIGDSDDFAHQNAAIVNTRAGTTLSFLTVRDNQGSGFYNFANDVTVQNSVFRNNAHSAIGTGGTSREPEDNGNIRFVVRDCQFINNAMGANLASSRVVVPFEETPYEPARRFNPYGDPYDPEPWFDSEDRLCAIEYFGYIVTYSDPQDGTAPTPVKLIGSPEWDSGAIKLFGSLGADFGVPDPQPVTSEGNSVRLERNVFRGNGSYNLWTDGLISHALIEGNTFLAPRPVLPEDVARIVGLAPTANVYLEVSLDNELRNNVISGGDYCVYLNNTRRTLLVNNTIGDGTVGGPAGLIFLRNGLRSDFPTSELRGVTVRGGTYGAFAGAPALNGDLIIAYEVRVFDASGNEIDPVLYQE